MSFRFSGGDNLILCPPYQKVGGKNAVDPWYHNYTALHWSAENGHRNVVIKLLHAKVDFNKRDKRGRSALHQVCLEGFESITSLLIGRGILIDVFIITHLLYLQVNL